MSSKLCSSYLYRTALSEFMSVLHKDLQFIEPRISSDNQAIYPHREELVTPPNQGLRLSTVNLLIKVGNFVKKGK
jgi:hypothetical protein